MFCGTRRVCIRVNPACTCNGVSNAIVQIWIQNRGGVGKKDFPDPEHEVPNLKHISMTTEYGHVHGQRALDFPPPQSSKMVRSRPHPKLKCSPSRTQGIYARYCGTLTNLVRFR